MRNIDGAGSDIGSEESLRKVLVCFEKKLATHLVLRRLAYDDLALKRKVLAMFSVIWLGISDDWNDVELTFLSGS
jgi:hypothetical protein